MPYDNPLVDGTYKIKAGDRLPPFEATLKDHAGAVVDLTLAVSATLHLRLKGSATVVTRAMTIDAEPTTGKVSYSWGATQTDTAGEYRAEIEILWLSGKEETFPGEGYFTIWFTSPLA